MSPGSTPAVSCPNGGMADAVDSKSTTRKSVKVQVLFRAVFPLRAKPAKGFALASLIARSAAAVALTSEASEQSHRPNNAGER